MDWKLTDNDQTGAMAKIHLIGGEKGGVGKSLVARALAQYFIDKDLPFVGFDTDRSHGALMRFYSGYASPVVVDRYEAMDTIMETAVAHPEHRILVDLAAQTHSPLVKWMDESGVLEMADEMGFAIHYWHVMDSGKDSTDLLKGLLDQLGPRLQYVLVRNEVRGGDFSILTQSGEQTRALALGAHVISIKRLHDGTINKIDSGSSSFWAAKNSSEKGTTGLGIMDRQRVKTWLRDTYHEFEGAGV